MLDRGELSFLGPWGSLGFVGFTGNEKPIEIKGLFGFVSQFAVRAGTSPPNPGNAGIKIINSNPILHLPNL
jgi:hypothetical protein